MVERVRHRVTLFKGRRHYVLKVFVGVCQHQRDFFKVGLQIGEGAVWAEMCVPLGAYHLACMCDDR